MAGLLKAQVTGLKELADVLKAFPGELRRGVMGKALRHAAAIVEADAKRRAPVLKEPDARRSPGTLRDAIRVTSQRLKDDTLVRVKVGVRRLGKRAVAKFKQSSGKSGSDNPDDPFYAMYVERGTHRRGLRDRQPFLRPALEANAMQAVERFREEVRRGVEGFERRFALQKGRRTET